ncbi:MAG: Holliday junction branch migration protein RuvA [Limnothrix sp.]|uniref:Holliday junction branch migration complex subunit RuvA n=1 Tax=Limnothrix redekei LRLZ20PSL1 TaxID=3112953 RepID=A0ABW7CEW5_9CYAN|nr:MULTISPECIES: Holliday junction branch migration protein RuvA [unclassified Limnothrix]MBD2636694.1 Holliday junction branch migration protein RuvA [Limnothrix sp. FACHB-881]MEB3118369.1 Holliday junction branch migration protein RuvA [Limnothrix sp.]OCQ93952.1 Holliday junction DNA helicase RuvA [Limnothrix sp. P13C2]PIB11621.1 ATP-dependent DNA helicase RuvA [Limnothrix sp. PR1529]
MIGSLRGQVLALQVQGNRAIGLLDVAQVGYEVQLLPRSTMEWMIGETVQVFTHLQLRDDRWLLFGFATVAERDLFRQLIAVNGVGPQLAIALLDRLELPVLIQAIVSGNANLLAKTPGIGPKTAGRIALELKTKLAEWRDQSGLSTTPAAGPVGLVREDVEMTLLALGYSDREVTQALEAVGQQTALSKEGDPERWIREAIAWLSQSAL